MTADGYTSIGHDKYTFFRIASLIMLAVVFIFAIMIFLFQGKFRYHVNQSNLNKKLLRDIILCAGRKIISRSNITEWIAVSFLIIAAISYFFSSYRSIAWQGSEGWFIGLETYLFLILTYLFISHLWKYNEKVWCFFLFGSGIVFILGILNRFSIYPIKFSMMAAHFISTLGNINWVAGYFSIMWPIGAGLYLFSEKKYLRCLACVNVFIAICLGIVQGAESIFLSFIAVYYFLLIICLGRWERYGTSYLELLIIFCFSSQLMRFLRTIFPAHFNYGEGGIGGFVTTTSFSLYLLLPVMIFYLLNRVKIYYLRGIQEKFLFLANNKTVKKVVIITPLAILALIIIIIIINTISPDGIFRLTESTFFRYNTDWGSFRGTTWNLGLELFVRAGLFEKLFGVGPDCFGELLYSFPDLAANSSERFGKQVLRNAHNEMLTSLVNIGIFGTIAYFGIFITFIIRFMKKANQETVLYVPVICVFSYLIHNTVSFGQILSLPFIFIIMGIGSAKEIL